MLFFNIPNIFNFGDNARQGYESRYESRIGHDSRNIALLEPLEITLNKLEDIRIRIGTRIEKETASGTDMTTVMPVLDSADRSLAFAEQSVAIATSTVTSDNPHPPYMETQNAYSALSQSKGALSNVLDAIINAENQASSTSVTLSAPHTSIHAKKRN